MKKHFTLSATYLLIGLATLNFDLNAQNVISNYIKVYFSQPVDTSFSSGVPAVCLPNATFDTLAAYINRAKYTIDIAQYEYQTYTGDPIYVAVNAAFARGVKVRYIQDGSEAATNSGVKLLNASIPVIASPTGGNYGIMHNKFIIIDEYGPDTTKTIVCTGSADWDANMNTGDFNNHIIFQSKVLAMAYTHEFDIMWGDTTHGGATNAGASLFGPNKPNSGTHIFTIGGSEVELYFSPSDGTNNEIITTINSATTDLYCGMNDFTETTDATDIVNRKTAGVFAAAILDQYTSGTATVYTSILPTGLGSNFLGYVNKNYLYHNKFLVVNPSAPCDDPKVLTGSHNWTSSADKENDENTVIVHNPTIANLYLQSFAGNFKAIGGTKLTVVANPCPAGIIPVNPIESELAIYPVPYKGTVSISYNLVSDSRVTICVYNVMGQKVGNLVNNEKLESGQYIFTFNGSTPGIYFLRVIEDGHSYVQKLIQEE